MAFAARATIRRTLVELGLAPTAVRCSLGEFGLTGSAVLALVRAIAKARLASSGTLARLAFLPARVALAVVVRGLRPIAALAPLELPLSTCAGGLRRRSVVPGGRALGLTPAITPALGRIPITPAATAALTAAVFALGLAGTLAVIARTLTRRLCALAVHLNGLGSTLAETLFLEVFVRCRSAARSLELALRRSVMATTAASALSLSVLRRARLRLHAVVTHLPHLQEFRRDLLGEEQRLAVVEVDALFPSIEGVHRDHDVLQPGAPPAFLGVVG
jgi:hypothetical protein